MPEWLTGTPWWVVVGLTFTVLIILFKVARWTETVNQRLDAVNKNLESVDGAIKEIQKEIKQIFGRLGPATTATGSPIRLTELGQSVSKALGAANWAAIRAAEVENDVVGSSAYDIQAFAFQYVEDCNFGEEMENKIKDCAFNRGLDRKQVLDVLAIELRDHLLRGRELDPSNEPNSR